MRILATCLLLAGSLVGCVGHYSSEHIDSRYHRCLADFKPLSGVTASQWDSICQRAQQADYDYRLSASRFIPTYPRTEGGSCSACVPRVVTVPGY